MHDDFFTDCEKKYDFKLMAEKMRQFLIKEGVKAADYEPDESIYFDGIAVSYTEHFPILDAPVSYSIHYDTFYGDDSCFSACVGVPRREVEISNMEFKKIATECIKAPGILVSFEERRTNSKYNGYFHVINSVSGKHVMDLDEMQQHLHEVRCVVTDIAAKIFERYSDLYRSGQYNSHAAAAKFEQVNSMADDDRFIVERDYFEELSYDPRNPINFEDTLDLTDLLDSAVLQ